ncbi:hypothetical protein ACFVZH_25375 [Streptomyces sp. NPDC059534]|uniref:hypothetical protein n=1 Tax=Streptomyces sp. NPDC059534 TaxID=3346859 RepID=UPI0036A4B048
MRQLPTPVRWAATALAVAACAGLSGCMSVSDEGAKPAPGASGGKQGAAAESDGGGGGSAGGGGSWNGRSGRSGPEAAGAGTESPVPSGSPSGTAKPSLGEVLPIEGPGGPGGTQKPQPTGGQQGPGDASGGNGGSGGGNGDTGGGSGGPGGGGTPTPEPTVPSPEPTPEPTVPTPEPTPEPTSNPTDPPTSGSDTQLGAMRAADGPGASSEPMASPQVGPV